MPDTPEINLARTNALNVSNVSTATDSLLFGKSPNWQEAITRGTLPSQGREDRVGKEALAQEEERQTPGSESLGKASYCEAVST